MNEYKIDIKYDWSNQIDAIDLATSILHWAKILQTITRDSLPKWYDIKIDVHSFREGSHITPILMDIIQVSNDVIQNEGVQALFASAVSVLPETMSVFADLFSIVAHLKWWAPEHVRSEWSNTIIQNCDWAEITVNYWTINYYVQPNIRDHMKKMVAPLKKEEISWFEIGWFKSEHKIVTTNITKDQVEYFDREVGTIQEEVRLVGRVYDLNRETWNGKIEMAWWKTSISFGTIVNKIDFKHLADSLKNNIPIRITWVATIAQWTTSYKSIEIISAEKIQGSLLPEEDDSEKTEK